MSWFDWALLLVFTAACAANAWYYIFHEED